MLSAPAAQNVKRDTPPLPTSRVPGSKSPPAPVSQKLPRDESSPPKLQRDESSPGSPGRGSFVALCATEEPRDEERRRFRRSWFLCRFRGNKGTTGWRARRDSGVVVPLSRRAPQRNHGIEIGLVVPGRGSFVAAGATKEPRDLKRWCFRPLGAFAKRGLGASLGRVGWASSRFAPLARAGSREAARVPASQASEEAHPTLPRQPRALAPPLLRPQRPGDPAGGVPGGGSGPQLSRPSVVAIGISGPAIAGVSRVTSAIALTRERTSRTSLLRPW